MALKEEWVNTPQGRKRQTVGSGSEPGATGNEGQVSALGAKEKKGVTEMPKLRDGESPAAFGVRMRKWREDQTSMKEEAKARALK